MSLSSGQQIAAKFSLEMLLGEKLGKTASKPKLALQIKQLERTNSYSDACDKCVIQCMQGDLVKKIKKINILYQY